MVYVCVQRTIEEWRAGIPDEEWHIDVIKHTLNNAGFYLRKVVLTNSGGSQMLLDSNGHYLIDGHLNRSYMNKTSGRILQEGYDDLDMREDEWRHAIVVKNNRMHCAGVGVHGISTANLWLDSKGTRFSFA